MIKYYDSLFNRYSTSIIKENYLMPIKKFLKIYANTKGTSFKKMFGKILIGILNLTLTLLKF